MKTLLLFLTFILVFAVSTTVEAQEKSQRAQQGWIEGEYWGPVFCDDVMVDYLEGGTLMIHYVYRTFKNGKLMAKEVDQIKGEIMSSSGETFTIRETDKWAWGDSSIIKWHYNLIGDRGSHYTATLIYNWDTEELTIGNTTCK